MATQMGREERLREALSFKQARLVEHFRDVNDAIACEKRLKGWLRSRKIALIEKTNPHWLDLNEEWEQEPNVQDAWNTEQMVRDSSLRSE